MTSKSKEITKVLRQCVAYMKNKSYLCNVFFMVLDFKVNEKGLSSDSPFFYPLKQTDPTDSFEGHSTASLRVSPFQKA